MTSSDPTAFDFSLDPTVNRMQGYARHGNTPFDMPIVSQIVDGLWQGGCETGLVLPSFVDHLVSLYPWERYTIKHPVQSEMYVTLYDSTDQGYELIDSLARWVNECRATGGNVLVHCQAGLNRSSLVAARALMLADDMDGAEAIRTIRDARSPACLCNPAFEAHLRAL